MKRNEVVEAAHGIISGGLNCAESVLRTACLHCGVKGDASAIRIATGFGGGVGAGFCELCGALAGGVMAIGLLAGRVDPEVPGKEALALAAEFRERFIAAFGSSNCGALREAFGQQQDWDKCRRLTADAAGLLFDLLEERHAGTLAL